MWAKSKSGYVSISPCGHSIILSRKSLGSNNLILRIRKRAEEQFALELRINIRLFKFQGKFFFPFSCKTHCNQLQIVPLTACPPPSEYRCLSKHIGGPFKTNFFIFCSSFFKQFVMWQFGNICRIRVQVLDQVTVHNLLHTVCNWIN